MAEHAHTTPTPVVRRRAARPAGAALDRRLPIAVAADAPVILTALDRLRIANNIALMIDLLDLVDGDTDREADDVDLEEGGDMEPEHLVLA